MVIANGSIATRLVTGGHAATLAGTSSEKARTLAAELPGAVILG